MAQFDQIPEAALDLLKAGSDVVLATVVTTWGSAPRPVGSQLLIGPDGAMVGSVSGGCVEGAVVTEAIDMLADGTAVKVLEFGVSDDDAFAVGLACGGQIAVLLRAVRADAAGIAALQALVAARAARVAVAEIIDLASGDVQRVARDGADAALKERFLADRSGWLTEAQDRFALIHNPPLRLIVIGAVHIAQNLVAMARLTGFAAVVIDPRAAFATPERFGETQLLDDWPDDAVTALGIDARTAVVALTHDPKLDDPGLLAALGTDAFYIGALGSTRTHAKRVARLSQAGVDAAGLARIHAPVGLDIGAKSPAEIAVSILAQIIQALRAS